MPTQRARDTMQVLYTKAAQHILHQGKGSFYKAKSGQDVCAYRGADNCKCAVGFFIKEGIDTSVLEGKSATSKTVQNAFSQSVPLGHLTFDDRGYIFSLLGMLQNAHDLAFSASGNVDLKDQKNGFARQMREIALSYKLIPLSALDKWLEV